MPPDSVTLETTLDDRSLDRLASELAAAGFPARVVGQCIHFDNREMGQQAQQWIERFIDYNQRIHAQAKREGRPLPRY